jgi:hypothetical protein
MIDRFADPRLLISLIVLGIFGWSFAENVSDDTMKGAIIGALNVVAGYWLGSSNSSNQVREQVGRAIDLAASLTPTSSDQPVERP